MIARKSKPKLSLGEQEPSLLFLGGGLLLGLLIAGVQWYGLSSEKRELDGRIRVAQQQVDELRPILEEVAQFKAKQDELQRKIEVINDLTLKQQGPVHIMDKVSRALPDLLWLSQMNVRGTSADLVGTAFNTNAIASFIENLDKVPEFHEPVLGTMNAGRGGNFSFRISFSFIQEQPETEDDG